MPDRIALHLRPDVLARGLWDISNLMTAGRVEIRTDWDRAFHPGRVLINVTGYPDERDELVYALGEPAPVDWQGSSGARYREWFGTLMTMSIVVHEQLPPGGAPAGDPGTPPASDPAASLPVPHCTGVDGEHEAACGEHGPHGPHELGDEPAPLDPVRVLRPATPRDVPPDLVPVDDQWWADPKTAAAWHMYAAGRCLHDLSGLQFGTEAQAVLAIEGWPGRAMISDGDVFEIARQLFTPTDRPTHRRTRPFIAALSRSRSPKSRAEANR